MDYRTHVLICAGAGCISSNCKAVAQEFFKELKNFRLDQEVQVVQTGCIGSCDLGPVIVVNPDGIFYQKVKPEDVKIIVEEHLLHGRPVQQLFYKVSGQNETIGRYDQIPFFNKQVRFALRNVGQIDPEVIDEYIARDGYLALKKVLTEMQPE
ncbi:MAG TPA: NAD(P)H-dependent oxidoreductase subunit E, partial [Bacillota bacterium]|nr:NAD(P)H-dependent oxidoreductase subunit E [Bacillota bacterium]